MTNSKPHPLFTICYRGYCRVAQIGADFKLNTGRYLNFSHHKIKLYATPIISILVIFTFLFVAIFGVYLVAKESISRQFQRTFEKKTLEQLNTFQSRTAYMTENFFTESFKTMENIAQDYQKYQADILDHDRKVDDFLSSIAVYDQSGTMLVMSSDLPAAHLSVGKNFAYREYFQSALKNKGVRASEVFLGVSGIYVVGLSTPSVSKNGETRVIAGFTYLSSLEKIIAPAKPFSFVLTDKDGNIILEDRGAPKEKINLKDKDNTISDLLAGSMETSHEEINYRGESVLAQGTTIVLPDKSHLYLVSFYPKAEFAKDLNLITGEIDRIYTMILAVLFTALILSFIGIYYLINHNEKIIDS